MQMANFWHTVLEFYRGDKRVHTAFSLSVVSSSLFLLHLLPVAHLRLMHLVSDCGNYPCPAAAIHYSQQTHKTWGARPDWGCYSFHSWFMLWDAYLQPGHRWEIVFLGVTRNILNQGLRLGLPQLHTIFAASDFKHIVFFNIWCNDTQTLRHITASTVFISEQINPDLTLMFNTACMLSKVPLKIFFIGLLPSSSYAYSLLFFYFMT